MIDPITSPPTYNHTGVEPVSPNETHGGKNIMSEPPLTEVNMGDERIPSGPHPLLIFARPHQKGHRSLYVGKPIYKEQKDPL